MDRGGNGGRRGEMIEIYPQRMYFLLQTKKADDALAGFSHPSTIYSLNYSNYMAACTLF